MRSCIRYAAWSGPRARALSKASSRTCRTQRRAGGGGRRHRGGDAALRRDGGVRATPELAQHDLGGQAGGWHQKPDPLAHPFLWADPDGRLSPAGLPSRHGTAGSPQQLRDRPGTRSRSGLPNHQPGCRLRRRHAALCIDLPLPPRRARRMEGRLDRGRQSRRCSSRSASSSSGCTWPSRARLRRMGRRARS